MSNNLTLPNGFKPRWYQQGVMDYFDGGGTRAVEVWPRRAGKDLTFVHQAAKAAHVRIGMYLHLLPTNKQARKVVWDAIDNDGRRVIDTAFPPILRESTNEAEMRIKFRCGSLWQLVGADYFDSLVGSNPVGLTMSEAAITDPAAWNYLRPILAGNGGWAAFIGTPRGNNWFKRLLDTAKKDPKWHWAHYTADQLGHISRETLDAEHREMPDELYRQEYDCDFSAANVGAIFGRWMEAADKQGRITEDIESIRLGEELILSGDIGRRDKAAFWWWRVLRGGAELVHYDEASGLDAEEWIERLAGQPRCKTIWLPHDAKVKTFQTRHSVIEQFINSGIADDVRIVPQSRKKDQINAGRRMLARCRFHATDCADGVDALKAYKYKYDEIERIFSQEPDHDWSSHAADGFMYGAQMVEAEIGDAPPQPKSMEIAGLGMMTQAMANYSLEQLWAAHQGIGNRRI